MATPLLPVVAKSNSQSRIPFSPCEKMSVGPTFGTKCQQFIMNPPTVATVFCTVLSCCGYSCCGVDTSDEWSPEIAPVLCRSVASLCESFLTSEMPRNDVIIDKSRQVSP